MATVKIECLTNAQVQPGCQFCPEKGGVFSGLSVSFGNTTKYFDGQATIRFIGETLHLTDTQGETLRVNFNDTTFSDLAAFKTFLAQCNAGGSGGGGSFAIDIPNGNAEYNTDTQAGAAGVPIGSFYVAGEQHPTSAQGNLIKRLI